MEKRLLFSVLLTVIGWSGTAHADDMQFQAVPQEIEVKCPPAEDVMFEIRAQSREMIAKAGAGWIRYPANPNSSNHQYWPDDYDPAQWNMVVPKSTNGQDLPVLGRADKLYTMTVWPEQNRVRCSYTGTLGAYFEATLQNCTPQGGFREYNNGQRHMCSLGFNEVSSVRDECSATCAAPLMASSVMRSLQGGGQ